MRRREFIKKSTAIGGFGAATAFSLAAMPGVADAITTSGGIGIEHGLDILERGKEKNIVPRIRQEIVNNPRSVFLIETNVRTDRDKRGFFSTAQDELEVIGKKVAHDIFVKGDSKGGSTLIKPNFTTVPQNVLSPVCGINTSPDFIAGFIDGLRELGNENVIVSERGGTTKNHRETGIYSVFDKHEINLIEGRYAQFSHYDKKELNWHKVSNPLVWKHIPTYRPIGDDDNLFINMPKLKCHNLGLTTLSIKNLQGAVPVGYGEYCRSWGILEPLLNRTEDVNFKRDFVRDYQQNVEAAFLKHREAGFKYWDYENYYPEYQKRGGWEAFKKIRRDQKKINEFMKGIERLMWDEQWCQRAIDSAQAIKPSLNIIEGVIGRDGSGFDTGKDELCNIIIVGMSPLEVDSVGSFIMGHDPRELYYTRIAEERRIGENNPAKISINWIRNGEIVPVKSLSEIKRYNLGVNMHTWAETGKRLFW